MKRLILLCVLGGFVCANSFIDAIKSGQKEGDVHLLYDFAHSNPNEKSGRYQNSSYLATSFGLYYKSAFWGYFRAHIGFRGALVLLEGKKSQYDGGSGDGARDFWDNNKAMLARSYLEYFDGDTSVKLGRIENDTDLIANHFDGMWISNKSLGFMLIDFVWMHQYGTVLPRELSGFSKITWSDGTASKWGGSYYLGLTFDITDWFKLKAYGLVSPQIYSFAAIKGSLQVPYFTLDANFANGFEYSKSEFNNRGSYILSVVAGTKIDLFYANLGYIKTSNGAGMGSIEKSGNSFNPFFYFSGDALNKHRDLDLIYGKVGIEAEVLKAYVVYGWNFFKLREPSARGDSRRYGQGEVNLSLDWRIYDGVNAIAYFLNTHGAKQAISNINQFGIAFKLGF